MKRSNLHFAIFGIVAIVAAVTILGSAQVSKDNLVLLTQPTASVKGVSTNAQATVVIKGLDQPIAEGLETLPTNGATALDLLTYATQKNNLELKTKNYGEMGTLVEGIGSVANGTDDRYWSFYINGTASQVAADLYQIVAGDAIEFRFEQSIY